MNKPFDIHGWDYANGRELVNGLIHKYMERHPEAEEQALGADYLKNFEEMGGKCFGLLLCQEIAKLGTRLHVPWFFSSRSIEELSSRPEFDALMRIISTNSEVRHAEAFILRSSEPEEDWIDPRSGVQESEVVRLDYLVDTVTRKILCNEQFVLQPQVWGIGFVVDIGYSELLGKPIARVAHGRKSLVPYGETYSSATWDGESIVRIYDALTGELISTPLSLYPELAQIIPELVRELVAGLKAIGIDFGVQFELVIDPAHTEKWHLVQIRPTPEAIRGMKDKPETSGELLYTTGKVSRAGEAEGIVEYVDDYDWPRRPAGRIIAWKLPGKWGGEMDHLIRASKDGASAHITPSGWMMNSAHGQFYRHTEFDQEKIQAVRKLLVLGTECCYSEFMYMLARLARESTRLRLVSDGLVGQIFRV